MKWRIKDGVSEKQANQPYQHNNTISSTNSMSFLANDNLTFQRFSDGMSINGHDFSDPLKSHSEPLAVGHPASTNSGIVLVSPPSGKQRSQKRKSKKGGKTYDAERGADLNEEDINYSTAVWTTTDKVNKILLANVPVDVKNDLDFKYDMSNAIPLSTGTATAANAGLPTPNDNNNNLSHMQTSNKNLMANNSTMKLLEEEDAPCKQSKCSSFRSIIFCLCLNVTFANVMRFPREFHNYGIVYLIPYITLLLIIGLPMVLFEISIGQFLGQGSAHTWRASPFFKGASIVSRFASWLITVATSMHAALAFLYIGYLIFEEVPFKLCSNPYSQNLKAAKSGQECLKITFLSSILRNLTYFGLLSLALIVLWIISLACTHSGKILRRAIYVFGSLGLGLLLLLTGWDIAKSIDKNNIPDVKSNLFLLWDSTIWFNALIQVIYSTQIGIGALPVLTGKYLYKGDAVKTSFVFIFFNIFVCALALTFFIFQYTNPFRYMEVYFPELTSFTAIYDKALTERDSFLSRLVPALTYLIAILSALVTIIINIYTTSRVFRKHRNYVIGILALICAVVAFICPEFIVARLIDNRFAGAFIVCAMTVEIISIIWVYGVKNIYTDLEFSIGRPVFKLWLVIWILTPLILAGLMIWWITQFVAWELLMDYLPRWVPTLLSMAVIVIMACIEVSKQVDYNIISMFRGATRPSKNWGPADPLVRHAWKQWTSKCEDTGERDFTLRRRGTKDYTNSIKRGQYPHTKYGTHTRNTSTQGTNSPNYSGSVFGDSAIEEDMSVDRYTNYKASHLTRSQIYPEYMAQCTNNVKLTPTARGKNAVNKSPSYVHQQNLSNQATMKVENKNNAYNDYMSGRGTEGQSAEENSLGQRIGTQLDANNYTSCIEIMPQESPNFKISVRNPMATNILESTPNSYIANRPISLYQDNNNSSKFNISSTHTGGSLGTRLNTVASGPGEANGTAYGENPDHICWRKFSANSEEFSTEL